MNQLCLVERKKAINQKEQDKGDEQKEFFKLVVAEVQHLDGLSVVL
jgi:hypothetical protein